MVSKPASIAQLVLINSLTEENISHHQQGQKTRKL